METDLEDRYRSAVAAFDAGELPAALATCRRLLLTQPEHAAALNLLGVLSAEEDDHQSAIDAFRRSIAARPGAGSTWHNLANSLDRLGRRDEARVAYARALEVDPGLAEAQFELAALGGAAVPLAAPARYVQRFFDAFAARYDRHFAQLDDRTPELLGRALREFEPARASFDLVVDLGCGTGRAADVLRPLAGRLIGVDLAPAMLAQARARRQYDDLVCAEIVAYLRATTGTADLIAAADVFTYQGELSSVIRAARTALKADGIFIFTVEASADADYQLDVTRRFRHSARYVEKVAEQQGFACQSQGVRLRVEPAGPVPGFVFVLRPE